MKIGIVGAGSIGMLFGAYLSESNHTITFLVRNQDMPNQLYIEKSNTAPQQIRCNIVYSMKNLYDMDLIIIAVKYHHLHMLKNEIDALPTTIPLLFLQNGLLHLPYSKKLKQDKIIVGSVLHGATKKNTNTVQHLGVGVTSIGMLKGEWAGLEELLHSANKNFPIQYSSEMEEVLFKKAMLNCLINPLTTITKVQNGELIKNESYKTILHNMFDELIEAFPEWQDRFSWEEVISLCTNTQYNRSSMLKDYENGRLMELDTIIGAIIEESNKRNKKLPILNTLYLLLNVKNEAGDQNR